MKLYFDRKSIKSIDCSIEEYDKTCNNGIKKRSEFASPYRSTVPLLTFLKHEQIMLEEILETLGMPNNSGLYIEYKVNPKKGKGNASHTDLMVISDDSTLAIEAKWTEPRYDIVSEWLKEGMNIQNRLNVLSGWIDLINKHFPTPFKYEQFNTVVYQMLHRAASACETEKSPKLAYLLFEPSPDPKTVEPTIIEKDLRTFYSMLGNPLSFPFYLIKIELSCTAAFQKIEKLEKGTSDTAIKVKNALRNDRLFDFSDVRITECK